MPAIKYLCQAEVKQFFSVIQSRRDRALFGFIYYYGLRVVEATMLQLTDVDFAHHSIFIRRVKGGIGGSCPLLATTEKLLSDYLPKRLPTSNALFTSTQGALSRRRIQQLFKAYAAKAGIDERYSVHSLRHSIATHLLDAGIDLCDVQCHLGHRSIASTLVYAKLTDKRRRRLFRKIEQSREIVKLT